jgi:MFS family permease
MNSDTALLASAGGASAPAENLKDTYRKITWRIAPVLVTAYALAFVDRINIGFAQLQMKADLGFSDAIYGTGAGIFFLGYFLCEVPSNLLLQKIGARLTLARIMFFWGAVSALTFLIQTPTHLYIARFLLGVFEAGLYPGLVLYLTYWYPPNQRATMMSFIAWGSVIAGIVAGPISGWILTDMDGVLGLRGWQWMFVIEGVPSSLFAIYILFLLADRPAEAIWLTDTQKSLVINYLQEQTPAVAGRPTTFAQMLANSRTWILALINFSLICGLYAGLFWMPSIIKSSGATVIQAGVYSAIPFVLGGVAMWFCSKHSDAHRERRWHYVGSSVSMIVGFLLLIAFGGNLPISLLGLTMIIGGAMVGTVVFWPIPQAYLSDTAAAGGIALINCIALLGGFVSPSVLGYIKTSTGSLTYGFYGNMALLAIGAAMIIIFVPHDVER